MSSLPSKKQSFRELMILAFPVMLGQLGLMLIGVGDMLIATQHSTAALSAIGLGVAFINPVFIVGLAFHWAISPLIAQRRGQGHDTEALLGSAIVYAMLLSLPFVIGASLTAYFVPRMGYDPVITTMVVDFIHITAWSIPGSFLYTAIREWLQAHERTWLANGASLGAVGVNLLFCWAFTFGHLGFPAMGVNGLAWASFAVRWGMGLTLLIPLLPTLLKKFEVDWKFIIRVINLGGPTAISMFFEVMAFCSVTLFVGKFGETQSAANNLVLTLASVTFMIPMAMASAVGVKVGHAWGQKNIFLVKRFAGLGLAGSVGFMLCTAITFALIPEQIIRLFGADAAVIVFAVKLIVWVALFQVFDGSQVTLGAILRGLSISKPVSVISFVGYWLVGIPGGWWMAHKMGYGAQGFWMGLTLSLFLVSLSLFILTIKKIAQAQKHHLVGEV